MSVTSYANYLLRRDIQEFRLRLCIASGPAILAPLWHARELFAIVVLRAVTTWDNFTS